MLRIWSSYFATQQVYIFLQTGIIQDVLDIFTSRGCPRRQLKLSQTRVCIGADYFSSCLENISQYTLELVMVQYLSCILLRQVKTRLLIFSKYSIPSIFYLNKECMYCHIFRFKMRNDLWFERKGVFVFTEIKTTEINFCCISI